MNELSGSALSPGSPPGIRAMVFDIDDTLYLRTVPYLSAFHEFFPGRGNIDEDALFRRNMQMSDEEYERHVRGETSFDEMHILRVQRTLAPFGITVNDEEARAFQRCYEQKQSEIRMTDGFRDVLEAAADRKVLLGVISNGNSANQRRKLSAIGVGRWIQERNVLVSGDIGISKPDARIFREFERRTGMAPQDIWMVGDSYATDIKGAGEAGWHTIWIERDYQPDTYHPVLTEKDYKPDYRFTDEREIRELICRHQIRPEGRDT
jgi:putative hydrolase of the HAD superfamily